MDWIGYFQRNFNILHEYCEMNSNFVLILLICTIYIVFVDKNKIAMAIAVYIPIITLVIGLFNPIIYKLAITYLYYYDRAYRYLWILQNDAVIAYTATKVVIGIKDNRKKYLSIIVVIIGIMMCGKIAWYNLNSTQYTNNIYRVPEEVMEISDIIEKDGYDMKVAGPSIILRFLHLYNPQIELIYAYACAALEPFDSGNITRDKLDELEDRRYVYIIVAKRLADDEFLNENGYFTIGETADYNVYRKLE